MMEINLAKNFGIIVCILSMNDGTKKILKPRIWSFLIPFLFAGRDSKFEDDLNLLLTGKVTLEYSKQLQSLLDLGLAIKPKYITDYTK